MTSYILVRARNENEFFITLSCFTLFNSILCIIFYLNKEPKPKKVVIEIELEEKQTCTICLEDIKIGASLCNECEKPVCNHVFHKKCIHEWTKKNMSCPNCRMTIV